MEVWKLEFLPGIVVALATLWFLGILAAGTRVAMSMTIDRALLAVGGGYVGWWVVGSILQF